MFGSGELMLIMGAILLLFGGKKLPEFAKNLGKGIREFKRACNGELDPEQQELHLKPEEVALPLDKDERSL